MIEDAKEQIKQAIKEADEQPKQKVTDLIEKHVRCKTIQLS
ncbi:hypothetical protein BsIDN1_26140 [Bacillus safensis]|uniref:Uncharacterized protein n=1 Tax=Bacillus safensis TaxID=561879 RepID=A0A5S9MBR3_BACIA|nr:hypothetical protein BsIDN1_26140 [Bacillus safensis]